MRNSLGWASLLQTCAELQHTADAELLQQAEGAVVEAEGGALTGMVSCTYRKNVAFGLAQVD